MLSLLAMDVTKAMNSSGKCSVSAIRSFVKERRLSDESVSLHLSSFTLTEVAVFSLSLQHDWTKRIQSGVSRMLPSTEAKMCGFV